MKTDAHDVPRDVCFLGEHEYAVDQQRRIALPKTWRRYAPPGMRLFLLPGRNGCLQLMPEELFQSTLAEFRRVSFAQADAMMALASIGALASEVSCDKQGRFSIAQNLLDHAEIGDKALLIGAVTLVQIWNPERWPGRRMDTSTSLDVIEALHKHAGAGLADALNRAMTTGHS